MLKSIIVEGKTTAEAIEKGLKELNTTKNMVEIRQIEEDKKRSFYSILAPRVVKIEMTMKEEKIEEKNIVKAKKNINKNIEDLEKVSEKLKEFFNNILGNEISCDIKVEDFCIHINIQGENINNLIGYRGNTINALQVLATAIANKNSSSKTIVIVEE